MAVRSALFGVVVRAIIFPPKLSQPRMPFVKSRCPSFFALLSKNSVNIVEVSEPILA